MSARKLTPAELSEVRLDELLDRMTAFVSRCEVCGRACDERVCERCEGSEDDKAHELPG